MFFIFFYYIKFSLDKIIAEYERTNVNLNKFVGNFITWNSDKPCNLDMNNVVLRGCSLRNTDILYGLVLYTGILFCFIKFKEQKLKLWWILSKLGQRNHRLKRKRIFK